MFNKDSDYYFIAYNIILILDNLKCYEGKSKFYDYRKLIYILPFISNEYLLNIAIKNKKNRENEIKILEDIYINARLREPILKSILFTLEKKGYLTLEKNATRKCIDIQLKNDTLPDRYLNSALFKIESENIAYFKKYYQRLSFITLESLIDKLFKEKGVIIWDV
ncbi:hypothetical protein [Priestia megaterium]|uniref:Uncharacterized protein n=1 Tax=Priestia megaterium TaxID=1404 RepID=A0A6M6DY41_PRIMG|nr:hypothetical protein [Priestia megaterium]QJX76988.1 hypothetical protein FDZ14_12525 [Priestia megaterium]